MLYTQTNFLSALIFFKSNYLLELSRFSKSNIISQSEWSSTKLASLNKSFFNNTQLNIQKLSNKPKISVSLVFLAVVAFYHLKIFSKDIIDEYLTSVF